MLTLGRLGEIVESRNSWTTSQHRSHMQFETEGMGPLSCVRGGSGASELRLGFDCGWCVMGRASWSIVVGHVVRTWCEWIWLYRLPCRGSRVPVWIPLHLFRLGCKLVSVKKTASLDADCDCGAGGSVLFDPDSVSEVSVLQ